MFRTNISRHGTVVNRPRRKAHDNGDFHIRSAATAASGGNTHALKEAT
jgi:hypothetical protein